MPTRCQDCNASFLLDGTTVVNGISCPDCGGTKLERDQPSPTHSDGELRDMVDPATQLDQGGNPLQEGVWAGVDGGWQPQHKRDETFAKVASRPGITWTPGVVGNGGWDTAGNLHAWNVKHLAPHGVTFSHPNPFIIGADGTLLSIPDPYTPHDVLDRVPGTKAKGFHPNLVAKTASFPPSGLTPGHHGTATPSMPNGLHNGNLHWLSFLDASVNGKPVRENWEDLWREHGLNGTGAPVTISVHHPEHLQAAIEVASNPHVTPALDVPTLEREAPSFAALGSAIKRGQAPAPPGIRIPPQQKPVMSNHYDRALPQEPYLPWFHQADVQRYPGDGGAPVTMTNDEWAHNKRQRYLDKNHGGHRLNWQPGGAGRGIMIGQQLHTWPVEKTFDNPSGGMMHGDYLSSLGVNPANVDVKTGFEINPDGTTVGNAPPEASQIDPNIQGGEADPFAAFGSTKTAIAPLLALGGRMLLTHAVGGLMKKAIGGLGNTLNTTAPAPVDPYGGNRPTSLIASEKVGVGHNAPFESPGSTPDLIEDHDPEAVDQSEFNDQSDDSNLENPNKDNADGGLAQSEGEDATKQKLQFREDGDGISQAEQLLPLILEYIESPESGLSNPQLKALHETLDKEIPGYLDHADEDDENVHKLLESLKNPDNVTAATHEAAPVYQGTPIPMAQGQLPMQGQGQQMAMPGTHQNPIQPGGMPVDGKCMNCGGVTNADGSCPQCGAAAGANQQGNLQAAPSGQQMNPPGIMRPALAKEAADHQGPITPQQKEVFAQYLIEQGRENEVAAVHANPGMYADEWAEYINKSTQPPEVDPAEQAPMPQVPPDQMGQMPVPGMSIPQPTAHKTADNAAPRCPKCESGTTSILSGEGECRCHRCGNIWTVDDFVKDKPDSIVSKRSWTVKVAYPDALNDAPNPVAAPAADATAPGDPEQQQDSTLSWQSADGTPLQVGQTYEMHNPGYAIPDIVKVEQVKPDSLVVTMEGEYNSPSDPQDQNGPGYQHEIDLQEAQTEGLTFNPVDSGEGEQEPQEEQDQADGIGQTVNTEPTRQSPEVPYHAKTADLNEGVEPDGICKVCGNKLDSTEHLHGCSAAKLAAVPTDECPKCEYGHITSSYTSPTEIEYECFRCAHQWRVADLDEDSELAPQSRDWLNEDSSGEEINFDPSVLEGAKAGAAGRDIREIAKNDPRNAEIRERLNKNAGAKFSPKQQKEFIDEEGMARNADRLNLDGTHYVESAFDNSKARPDRVNDNYLGLGL